MAFQKVLRNLHNINFSDDFYVVWRFIIRFEINNFVELVVTAVEGQCLFQKCDRTNTTVSSVVTADEIDIQVSSIINSR